MSYVLESQSEFERLEKQSCHPNYDFKKEIETLAIPSGSSVLDAGCGSGIVSRFLAERDKTTKVTGCDMSDDRIEQAKNASKKIKNLTFQKEDICNLSFKSNSFDIVLTRYVLQHLSEDKVKKALGELFRVLKPGGTLCLVDTDNLVVGLYPTTKTIDSVLQKFTESKIVDFFIGRKLPSLTLSAGFENVDYEVSTITSKNGTPTSEVGLMSERLQNAFPHLEKLAESKKLAQKFVQDYLSCMQKKGAVFFINKFIVSGTKPKSLRLVK